MEHILIVEDDADISSLIARQLQKEGYAAHAAYNGKEALDLINSKDFQLIILDLMLPIMGGFEILKYIRAKSTAPVIILSAKASEADKIQGLDLGADDYISKPFTIGELIARAKASLRRSFEYGTGKGKGPKAIVYEDLTLSLDSFEAYVNGQLKPLTAKEFAILRFFIENPTRVFTKTQIFEAVWQEESYSADNTVMVHINRLRSKIEPDPSNPRYIQTVWGFGYKLGGQSK